MAKQKETQNGVITISVESKKTDRSMEFEKNLGADLDEAVALYSSEVVYDYYKRYAKIRAQGAVRSVLNDPENTIEDAQKTAEEFTPGVISRRTGGGSKKNLFKEIAERVKSGEISKEEAEQEIKTMLEQLL